MKTDQLTYQLKSFAGKLRPILRRHMFIMLLIVLGAAIYAVFSVNQILSVQDDVDYRLQKQQQERVVGRFDKATVKEINDLRDSNVGGDIPLENRTRQNPFN